MDNSKKDVWTRHGELIAQLLKNLKNRRNVSRETIGLVKKINVSFDRIQRFEAQPREPTGDVMDILAQDKEDDASTPTGTERKERSALHRQQKVSKEADRSRTHRSGRLR